MSTARFAFVSAVVALAAAGPATAASSVGSEQVLVRFAAGTTAAQRATVLAEGQVDVVRRLSLGGGYVVDPETGQSVADAVAELERSGDVTWAEPNVVYTTAVQPSDPLFGRQWSLTNGGQSIEGVSGRLGSDIGAATAWDTTTGSANISVGVVDTGVALDQPDLVPNLRPGRDFVDRDDTAADLDGHGTLVAGIVGARGGDGVGVAGVAWSTGIVPLRALDAEGRGTAADVADAFRDAGLRGLPIVNASLGGPTFSQAISDAITSSPKTLFVIAAGNDGRDVDGQPSYPCTLPADNIVCVAATDQSDVLAPFSNVGVRGVDLAAPGVNVLGPQPAFGAPVFADDFETASAGRWIFEPASGWTPTTSARYSGTTSIGVQGNGTGGASTDIARTAAPVSLTGQQGCRVSMRLRVDAGSGAGVAIDASSDGASWTELRRSQGSTQGRFALLNAYLDDLDGAASVFIRLRYTSRGAGGAAFADDVQISCLGGTYGDDDYISESGTSFASPHVAGVAALVAARHPYFSTAELKRALLEGVTPIAGLSGRVATGGRLSAPGSLSAAGRIAENYRPGATTGTARTAPGGIQLEGVAQTRGLAGTARFEWGPTTAYGSGTAERPLGALGTDQTAAEVLAGLTPRTSYHYRLVVSTPAGVSTGADQVITTGAITAFPKRFGINKPRRVKGVWRVTITLPRPALTEIVVQRRTVAQRPIWKKLRVVQPRDRAAGLLDVKLGRLSPGRYRIVARFPEARIVRNATFSVAKPAGK